MKKETTFQQFKTLAEVKKANKQIGDHFFDRQTMEFFNSRIESKLINNNKNQKQNKQFFITSEQFKDNGINGYIAERLFTIREATKTGEIKTIGEFQGYNSKEQAKKELKQ